MKRLSFLLIAFLAAAGLHIGCVATADDSPRLVVGIVVDQMRWDYLQRYSGKWSGGISRLLAGGYSFDNTYLCYVPTVTAAGHASIYTGTTPAFHGIAGNDFMMDGRKVYCTADPTVRTVGSDTDSFEHGTTHGVWNPYDSHIPLLFYGWGVSAGRSAAQVSVTDIATTVCSMLHIQQPNASIGRVLDVR